MKRKRVNRNEFMQDIKLPSEKVIIETAKQLLSTYSIPDEKASKYAPVQHLLSLIGAGESVDTASLTQYNPYYIKRTLKRMKEQELIETIERKYVLTQHGKRWLLKYTLDDLHIPTPPKWDGRWRMIIYDVARHKASLRNIFRTTIRRLGFHNIQESVWIYPYPCEKEITFLRDYCGMGSDVIYVIAHKIENDSHYKEYFKL